MSNSLSSSVTFVFAVSERKKEIILLMTMDFQTVCVLSITQFR